MIRDEARTLVEDYIIRATELEEKGKPWDGILGFGSRPADDPCHTRMVEELVSLVREGADRLEPGEARAILADLAEIPLRNGRYPSIYWTLIAAQGAGLALVPRLTREEAAGLLTDYRDRYPRRTLLPVQKLLVKALEKAAK